MPRGGHVDADLVGAPRLQLAFHVGEGLTPLTPRGESLQHGVVGDGGTDRPAAVPRGSAHREGRHFLAVGGVAPHGKGQSPRVLLEVADAEGMVDTADGMGLELGGELGVGLVVLGHHQKPRGVLVDAVDDPRPLHSAHPRQRLAASVEQSVDQSPRVIPGGGMHHHAHRLVDHDDIVVLKDHIQGNVLGKHVVLLSLGMGHGEGIPRLQLGVLVGGNGAPPLPFPALHGHTPRLNESDGGGAGQLHDRDLGEVAIQPHPRVLGGDGQGFHAALFQFNILLGGHENGIIHGRHPRCAPRHCRCHPRPQG